MSEKDQSIHIDRNDPNSPFQQGRRMAEENPEEARRIRKMFLDALSEATASFKCKKCGNPRLQNYTLCDKCLKKKKSLATFGVIVAFLLFYFLFAFISGEIIEYFNGDGYLLLGSLFWCLLLPYLIKKARAKVDEKYKLKESDKSPIAQPQTPAPTPASPIPPDIKFPKYTEEQTKDDEREKLIKRISDLYRENEELKKRKPKKAFVAVIVVLSVLLASVSGFAVYQQLQIQDLDKKYHDTHLELYEEKSAREQAEGELARIDFQKDAYNFYLKNAVCVYPNGPYYTYYHKATCEWFKSADRYRIYNVEAAEAKGYKPCPNCFTYN